MSYPSDVSIPRLRERPAGSDDEADRAAAMVRGSFVPRDPNPAELARIAEAVALPAHRRPRGRVVLRLTLAVFCMVAGGATVKAFELARRAGWLGSNRATPKLLREPEPSRTPRRRAARTVAPTPLAAAEDQQATPSEEPQLGEAPVVPPAASADREAPRPRPSRPRVAAPVPSVAEPVPSVAEPVPSVAEPAPSVATPEHDGEPARPSVQDRASAFEPPALPEEPSATSAIVAAPPAPLPAVSDEVRAINRAIGFLRHDHNAAAALAALDGYLDRYPRGALRREAHLARIDALLMLRRTDQALEALDVTDFDPGLRSTELLVVRAELRAVADCRRAEQDFTTALGRGPDARLLERILHGRGACRIKLQNRAGAKDDLGRYLERFPEGTHAGWARRWLASQQLRADSER